MAGPSKKLDTIVSKMAEAQAPPESFIKPLEGAHGVGATANIQCCTPTSSGLSTTAAEAPSPQLLTPSKQFAGVRQAV